MSPPVGFKLTYEDYLRFPDDGKRHEIIDGEDYVSAAPITKHQRVSMRLSTSIANYVRARGAGEVFAAPMDVVLSPYDVLQPDLLFVSEKRRAIVTEKNILGPPDLVVEITSESSRKIDEHEKLRRYELFGISEYWVVDPEAETATIYRLEHARYTRAAQLSVARKEKIGTPLLPGLEIPLTEVFAA
jgi:Uma2 family endonuclease